MPTTGLRDLVSGLAILAVSPKKEITCPSKSSSNYKVVLPSKSVSFKEKELPVLKKDDQKEITLTSIGIFLVGLSGYILVSSYEKKGEK